MSDLTKETAIKIIKKIEQWRTSHFLAGDELTNFIIKDLEEYADKKSELHVGIDNKIKTKKDNKQKE